MKNKAIKKLKNKELSYLLICLLTIVNCQFLISQTPINLQAAIDTALKNNLSVKNEKLKSDYQKKIIKTSASIPQSNVTGEYGQINSAFYDNRFGISQSFNFPSVYVNQKQLLNEEWKTSIMNVTLKEAETKKYLQQTFYMYLYLKEKEKLLLKNDSIYANFLEKTNLRFTKGESNILEKTTAESQRGTISIQLKQLQQDLEITRLQFSLLLNTNTIFIPTETNFKLEIQVSSDNSLIAQHPSLKIMEQQKKLAMISRKVERAKLLPEFNIGYYNMTMQGSGADNKIYTTSSRFQSMQVGLGIPLFFGTQKAKINASKINQSISENSYALEKKSLENQYQSVLSQYQTNVVTVNYFETTGLKNAQLILETANKQFMNGEINYLDWVMLTNQAINIQSNYLYAIKNLNESIIQINYLITK
jgi:cobalt-zinc-cadmium resistance protein CzcA